VKPISEIAQFLGIYERRHYNGRVPACAKASPFNGPTQGEEFPLFTKYTGATMRPESGIIDCAFENS
jgi:hypothetical protein